MIFRKRKVWIIIAIALLATLNIVAKNKKSTVYAFGVAASFNDSTVYFTTPQPIDSAWIESKTHFLDSRDQYSNQLRNYLEAHGDGRRTCIIIFALTEKEIQKKYTSTRKKYTEKNNFSVKDLATADFSFKSVPNSEIGMIAPESTKTKKRNRKTPRQGGEQPKSTVASEN